MSYDIGNIMLSFLLQLLFTVGVIVLFGFLISLCNKLFYSNFGSWGRAVCYVTGAIGTPIHECSHALFCLIFGHKIEEMRLFQIDDDDGTLGYVWHSYNRRNVYHIIGNFFIGIAPIIVITALLYLLALPLAPSMLDGIFVSIGGLDVASGFMNPLMVLWDVIKAIFSQVTSFKWWLFVIIGSFLCLHATLSGADIKSTLGGGGILIGALLITNLILGFFGGGVVSAFTNAILSFGICLASFLMLSLAISLVAVLFSFLIRLIFRR